MEIKENEVYTPKETQVLLKVSSSTMTRMIKKRLIQTARVGRQYRILGKELLRVLSPKLEDKVGKLYNKGRKWAHSDSAGEPKVDGGVAGKQGQRNLTEGSGSFPDPSS